MQAAREESEILEARPKVRSKFFRICPPPLFALCFPGRCMQIITPACNDNRLLLPSGQVEPQVVPKVVPKATAQFRVKPKASALQSTPAAVHKASSLVTATPTADVGLLKRSRVEDDEGDKKLSKTGTLGAVAACSISLESVEGDGLAGLLGGYGSDDSEGA